MGRKKKVKVDITEENQTIDAEKVQKEPEKEQEDGKIAQKQDESKIFDDPNLPNKPHLRVDEVARYLRVSERCVRLWIEHGHLDGVKAVGVVRVVRKSVFRCMKKMLPKRIKSRRKP